MAGPSTAMRGRTPRAASASTVAPITSPTRPRQPQCTTATVRSSSPARPTRRQSAPTTAIPRPDSHVITASASPRSPGAVASTTSVPWTPRGHARPAKPISRHSRSRFSPTETGSSPTCRPRLRESYGGRLHPPERPVAAQDAGRPPGVRAGITPEWSATPRAGSASTTSGSPGCRGRHRHRRTRWCEKVHPAPPRAERRRCRPRAVAPSHPPWPASGSVALRRRTRPR